MNAHSFLSMFRRQNLIPLTAAFLLLLVTVCGFVASRAQEPPPEGEREVVEKIPKHLPIKVKVRKPEKLKDAKNEEWLGEAELEVTNTGTKPIYHLHISLSLPDVVAPNGRNFGFGFEYGRSALVALDEPVRPDDVPLQPGGVVVLKAPAEQAMLWRRGRERGDRANPKKLEFRFNYLSFGDGTGFVGGKPIPEPRERGANAPCAGGDGNAVGAVSAAYPPRSYFPDIASLATYLPPPANLVPVFFFGKPALPAPAAGQDLCCTSPCSRLKRATDQGCPCPGVVRNIVQPTSCSDPASSCGTVIYESKECIASGVTFFCEESFINPTCAAPTPTPDCTPTEPEPDPCCTPELITPDPNLPSTQFCRWNCTPGRSACGEGMTLANGCVLVGNSGPVVCDGEYVYDAQRYGGSCCPPPPPCLNPGEPCNGGVRCCDGMHCHAATLNCAPNSNSGCDQIDEDWCEWAGGRMGPDCKCRWGGTGSPVVVDVLGDGFSLTDAAGGVRFDLDGDGAAERISWTAGGADDAWLALDRDGDGVVDDGRELFGNFTEQPAPPPGEERNGFLAPAEYDKPRNGGNGDGLIDARDSVFSSLRLWRDANHDGVSQPTELRALPALDVARMRLDYKESKRVDGHGNAFRYRAKVDDARGAKAGRWAWDVFLVIAP